MAGKGKSGSNYITQQFKFCAVDTEMHCLDLVFELILYWGESDGGEKNMESISSSSC